MTQILIILGCVVLSFFFSGMETGVLLVNRARIRHLKERGSWGASMLLDFMHHPGHLSATVLVGNTVVNTVATVIVGHWFLERNGPWVAAMAVILFALILWFIGDMLPKALFRRFPNRLSTRLSPLLWLSYLVFWPSIQLFYFFSQNLVRLMGGHIASRHMFVTRDELKLMAREVGHGISLTGEQSNLVASVLDSPNATAGDIMVPRVNVVTVKTNFSESERQQTAITTHFSRLPIETDPPAQRWIGLWIAYDSIFLRETPSRNPPRIEKTASLEETLLMLRKARSPMGFVKDKDGNDVGVVTIDDVLRKYFGKMNL